MNEYIARREFSQVDRVTARTPSAVPAVQPVSPAHGADSHGGRSPGGGGPPLSEYDLASAAEYAKVHARVADILAELRLAGPSSVDDAAAELQSLVPAPIILVPLPPASKEAVESAVELGKRIAEQASYAHAAQAHLRRGTVDQLLSPAV